MRCTNFSTLFWHRTLQVSGRFTLHQESSTVYTTTGIFHTVYADCLLPRSGCSILISVADSQHILHEKYLLIPDVGQKTCPKHVEFYTKRNLRNSASRWFYYRNR